MKIVPLGRERLGEREAGSTVEIFVVALRVVGVFIQGKKWGHK